MCTLDLFEHVNCSLYRFIPCNVIFFLFSFLFSAFCYYDIITIYLFKINQLQTDSDFLMFKTQMLMRHLI